MGAMRNDSRRIRHRCLSPDFNGHLHRPRMLSIVFFPTTWHSKTRRGKNSPSSPISRARSVRLGNRWVCRTRTRRSRTSAGTAGTAVCSSSQISRPRRPSDPSWEPVGNVFFEATRRGKRLNNEHMKVHRFGHEHAFSIPRSMRSSSTRLARFDAVPDSHDHLSSHVSYDVGDGRHSRVFTSPRALSSHVDRLDRLAVDARVSESPEHITHTSLHPLEPINP